MKNWENMPYYQNSPAYRAIFSLLGRADYAKFAEGDFDEMLFYSPDFLNNIESKIVVDLGCGWGSHFIRILKERGYKPRRFIHIDANPAVFNRETDSGERLRASELYDWRSDFKICADGCALPFANESIDIVHESKMIADNVRMIRDLYNFRREYIIDEEEVVGEISRVLKNGGYFIFYDDPLTLRYICEKRNLEVIRESYTIDYTITRKHEK